MIAFPFSSIVHLTIESKTGSYNLRLPEHERFLIDDILYGNEYAIMEFRSNGGPLRVMDIGANVGLFAIYMKFLDPDAIIYCFEPTPSTFILLDANTRHIPGITSYPYGLFNGEHEAILNTNRLNPSRNSIKIKDERNDDSIKITLKDTATEFDRLALSHLDVLKVDTEGCEVEILESLGSRMDILDYVLVEYHSEGDRRKIDALLKEFHLFGAKIDYLGFGLVKYVHSRLIP